jgi:threonine/homoserine/homoserine lactone efflux protein
MGGLLLELVPTAVGLALTPTAIAASILFLSSKRPVANALAFAAPFALVYSTLAVLALIAAHSSAEPLLSEGAKHWITFLIGLVLLAAAVRSWLTGRHPVATATKSKVLEAVDSANPLSAFGIGLAIAVLNPNIPILFAGLATIVAAEVSTADRIVGAAFLVLASEVGILGPVVWYMVQPRAARRGLGRVRSWLALHQHAVNLAVLVFFGAVFALKGLGGLLG